MPFSYDLLWKDDGSFVEEAGPGDYDEGIDISALVSYYLDGGDSESEDWSNNLVYDDFESVDGGFSSRSVVCSNGHLGTVDTESLVYEKMTEFDKDMIGIDHIKNGKGEENLDIEDLVSFYLDAWMDEWLFCLGIT